VDGEPWGQGHLDGDNPARHRSRLLHTCSGAAPPALGPVNTAPREFARPQIFRPLRLNWSFLAKSKLHVSAGVRSYRLYKDPKPDERTARRNPYRDYKLRRRKSENERGTDRTKTRYAWSSNASVFGTGDAISALIPGRCLTEGCHEILSNHTARSWFSNFFAQR
jgi:hypothetical protein